MPTHGNIARSPTRRRIWRAIAAVALTAFLTAAPNQLVLAGTMTVAVFDNGSYVDTGGAYDNESDTVQASLASLGHTVTTFTGFNPGDWTAAGASADLILIPELETGDLNGALTVAARTAISDYVATGGGLLIMGSAVGRASNLMNSTFGFSLVFGGTTSVPSSLNPVDAAGTLFASGPASLPSHSATWRLDKTTLPAGSLSIYETSATRTSMFVTDYALGHVGYLGWDWFAAAPIGSKDSGWLSVLDSATMFVGAPDEAFNDPTIPDLIYNTLTGSVVIDPDDAVGIVGYNLQNDANAFASGNHTPVLGGDVSSFADELAEVALGGITTSASIGNVFPLGLDLAGLTSLLSVNQVATELGTAYVPFDLIVVGETSAVPEPSTYAMAGLALLGLGFFGRRRQKRHANTPR